MEPAFPPTLSQDLHPLQALIQAADEAIGREDFDTLLDPRHGKLTRRATYVFRREADGAWRCAVDNSYGTDLLEATT